MSPTFRLPFGLDGFYRTLGEMGIVGHFDHPKVESAPKQGWKDDYQLFHYVPEADLVMAMAEVSDSRRKTAAHRLARPGLARGCAETGTGTTISGAMGPRGRWCWRGR